MQNFPNVQKFISVLSFIFSFILFDSIKAQSIVCPYPVNNILGCNVDVSYEYVDAACSCPSGCGPLFITLGAGITNLPAGACCSSARDIIIHIDGIATVPVPAPTAADPFTCVSGGCGSWGTNHSGTDPAITSPCIPTPSIWNITWSSSGAIIYP